MAIGPARTVLAFVTIAGLSGCGVGGPRDAGYFVTHADEAKLVVTRGERGPETGNDCQAAAQAVAQLEDKAARATRPPAARE